MRSVFLLGRLLFSMIFILSGLHHFSKSTIDYAASQGLSNAEILVPLSGVIALVGGLSILLGFHARVGAWLLVLFLVPVSIKMHGFWNETDPNKWQQQMIQFQKNMSMLGGALIIAYLGSGPLSIDSARKISAKST